MIVFLATTLTCCVLLACVAHAEEAVPVPNLAEQHDELRKDFYAASGKIRLAKTGEERRELVRKLVPYPARLAGLAESDPANPLTLEILRDTIQALGSTDSAALLAWETDPARFGSGCIDDTARRIVTILENHHLRSDQLGAVLDRMRYGYRLEFGEFLGRVVEENPHPAVRAEACIARGLFLADRLEMIRLANERRELWHGYERVFGRSFVTNLQSWDQAGLRSRIEDGFEEALREFPDQRLFGGGSVAERARGGLRELRQLAIGRRAPEIEGQDQDGQAFNLSDYRGKVVLLYFWSEY